MTCLLDLRLPPASVGFLVGDGVGGKQLVRSELDIFPDGQLVHEVFPIEAWYLPFGQPLQYDFVFDAWYLPAGQPAHACE